jgi:hypothetical protein
LAKTPSVSLTKMIEATKLQPRTGLPLGVPPVTIPFGALIEPLGSDRDCERFNYLSELYECEQDLFLSATGGDKGRTHAAEEDTAATPNVEKTEATAPTGPRLVWGPINSSNYSVSRAAIPGGWLVALHGSGVTFVPDAKHAWDGGSQELDHAAGDV